MPRSWSSTTRPLSCTCPPRALDGFMAISPFENHWTNRTEIDCPCCKLTIEMSFHFHSIDTLEPYRFRYINYFGLTKFLDKRFELNNFLLLHRKHPNKSAQELYELSAEMFHQNPKRGINAARKQAATSGQQYYGPVATEAVVYLYIYVLGITLSFVCLITEILSSHPTMANQYSCWGLERSTRFTLFTTCA